MRSILYLAAVASGEAAAKHHFPTFGKAFQFVKDSVLLSFDVSCFAAKRVQKRIMTFIPDDQQKQIVNFHAQCTEVVDKQRQELGLPTLDVFHNKVQAILTEQTETVVGLVYMLNDKIENYGVPIQGLLDGLFDDFAKTYPDAPLLSKGLVDRFFIILFVFYIIIIVLKCVKCFVCLPCRILGICCSRKSGKAAPTKATPKKVNPNSKKNK